MRYLPYVPGRHQLPGPGPNLSWTETARAIISDTPPPGKAKTLVKTEETAESRRQSAATKRAAEAFPVTLYTSAECVADCKQARDLLNGRGVPFTEKDGASTGKTDELTSWSAMPPCRQSRSASKPSVASMPAPTATCSTSPATPNRARLWQQTVGRIEQVKIASWNVNSLKVRLPHLLDWLASAKSDVLCLQELEAGRPQFPDAEIEAAGYQVALRARRPTTASPCSPASRFTMSSRQPAFRTSRSA